MTPVDESTPTFTPESTAGASAGHGLPTGRLRRAFRGRRGSAQLGLLVAATAVAGGLTIGSGIAAESAKSGYDLAWLADGTRGQVVQVDPVLGRTNVRLQVASPGDDLDIQQGNGQLVIVDRKTGKVSSIDLGTLLVGGSRTEQAGAVKVLLGGERMYVANLPRGTVQAVDPRTEATVGTPWTAPGGLLDVGIDGQHHVWALGSDQTLTSLAWQPSAGTLVPISSHRLSGTGEGSVIVGHPRGVTVVGAQGTVARVGTGHDSTVTSPQVHGPLAGPQSSPSGLVPVSDPGNSSVVIVGDGGTIVDRVDNLGCDRPGAPIAFDGKVYVPCLGAGMVVVLDSSGHQAAEPIRTPGGGDPQLTVSGGHLLVSAPGATSATVVDGSGDTHSFPTVDPTTPVQDPSSPPSSPPAPPPASPTHHPRGSMGGGHDNPQGGGDPSTDPSTGPSSGAPDHGGGSASATARADGTVLVTWSGPSGRGGYTVTAGGTPVAQVPSGASSATVTVLDPGTTTTLTVHAYDGDHHEKWAATTNVVTVGGAQAGVTDVRWTAGTEHGGVVTLAVSWTAPTTAGQYSYQLASSLTTSTVTSATTSASIDVPCSGGCKGTITVTPSSGADQGTPARVQFTVGAVAPTQPAQPPSQPTTQPTSTAPSSTSAAPAPTTQAPAPVALPGAGEQVLVSPPAKTVGNDSEGVPATVTLSMSPPGDWAGWSDGSCAIYADGVLSADQQITCGQTGTVTPEFDYDVSGTHTYFVRATAHDGRTVDSAQVSVTVRVLPGSTCGQQPFASIPGVTGGSGGHDRLPGCEPTCGQYLCWHQSVTTPDAAGGAVAAGYERALAEPAERTERSPSHRWGVGDSLLATAGALTAAGALRRWPPRRWTW